MKQLTKKQKTIQVQRQIKKHLKQLERKMFNDAENRINLLDDESLLLLEINHSVFLLTINNFLIFK